MDKFEPAFPQPTAYWDEEKKEKVHFPGMSLRDWFAGQAMQGLAAQFNQFKASEVDASLVGLMAAVAYRFADAMLKMREKTP